MAGARAAGSSHPCYRTSYKKVELKASRKVGAGPRQQQLRRRPRLLHPRAFREAGRSEPCLQKLALRLDRRLLCLPSSCGADPHPPQEAELLVAGLVAFAARRNVAGVRMGSKRMRIQVTC